MTKSEARYRTKLIQELHYTKGEQAILDSVAVGYGGYRNCYNTYRRGKYYDFMMLIAILRLGKAARNAAITTDEFTEAVTKWKCYFDKERVCTNSLYCEVCKHQPAPEDKPNGRKPPVKIDEYDPYGAPVCPACGEMPYSGERCFFCGQEFFPTAIEEDKPELKGAHEDKDSNHLLCDKCHADLAMDNSLRLTSHFDGTNTYGYTYKCKKCGNEITMTYKRKVALM